MDLATELMRQTLEREIYALENGDGTWSGWEYVNHPTPSGCTRMLPTVSDNRRWPDQQTALEEFKKILPKPVDFDKLLKKEEPDVDTSDSKH